jgi:hypothetical protein
VADRPTVFVLALVDKAVVEPDYQPQVAVILELLTLAAAAAALMVAVKLVLVEVVL